MEHHQCINNITGSSIFVQKINVMRPGCWQAGARNDAMKTIAGTIKIAKNI